MKGIPYGKSFIPKGRKCKAGAGENQLQSPKKQYDKNAEDWINSAVDKHPDLDRKTAERYMDEILATEPNSAEQKAVDKKYEKYFARQSEGAGRKTQRNIAGVIAGTVGAITAVGAVGAAAALSAANSKRNGTSLPPSNKSQAQPEREETERVKKKYEGIRERAS